MLKLKKTKTKNRVLIAIATAAVLCVACFTACSSGTASAGSTTSASLPSDHLEGTAVAADHTQCATCHEDLKEDFSAQSDLYAIHQDALTKYQSGSLDADGAQIAADNADKMKAYFDGSSTDCSSCHKLGVDDNQELQVSFNVANSDETTPDQMAFCLQCHDYNKVTEATAGYWTDVDGETPINPHASHLGEADCTLCHSMHADAQVNLCNECHYYQLPDGWENPIGRYRDTRSLNVPDSE